MTGHRTMVRKDYMTRRQKEQEEGIMGRETTSVDEGEKMRKNEKKKSKR